MFAISRRLHGGFTIVELLVVIVIIGILASITIVAYNGAQDRAYDANTKDAVSKVADALQLYTLKYGTTLKGDSGSATALSGTACTDGGGQGFFGRGVYTCTTEEMLTAAGDLPDNFSAQVPKNTYYAKSAADGRYSLMIYKCTASGAGRYALYWTLRAPSKSDSDSINSTLTQCSNSTAIRDTYGMRAARIIQL